jgi:hypothetical protein
MREQAEVFDGDRFIQRGRGRPKSLAPKEQVNIRLDAAVLGRLRGSGPGWQSRAAAIIGESLAETTLQHFDFPVDVAVTLPSGKIARGTGVITVRAPDPDSAVKAFAAGADPGPKPALTVQWREEALTKTSAKPQR